MGGGANPTEIATSALAATGGKTVAARSIAFNKSFIIASVDSCEYEYFIIKTFRGFG
jgi:hypothetical protein